MDDTQKVKFLAIGTAILFILALAYVGAGTGFIGGEDTNALNISDYNALLIECRSETSTLIDNNIKQSNTITNVNDLLNKSRNETTKVGTDLNICIIDTNTCRQKNNDLNQQIYDLNTTTQLYKNNLANAITLNINCEGTKTDLNTSLRTANQTIQTLTSGLTTCNNTITSKNSDINGLQQQIIAKDTTINTQTDTITGLNTLNTALDLNLTSIKDYLCDTNGSYCCDANLWWWC